MAHIGAIDGRVETAYAAAQTGSALSVYVERYEKTGCRQRFRFIYTYTRVLGKEGQFVL